MKKEFIKLSAILCLITLVAGLLLAGVNGITAPAIESAEEKAAEEAMKKVLPDAEEFENLNENVVMGLREDGSITGYCVQVVPVGYGGDITMMVGIGYDRVVTGIDILNHSETPGLGANIKKPEFMQQFKGKSPKLEVVKGETNSISEIQAVTGATISSRAVAQGIEEADRLILKALEEAQK